MVKDQYPNKTSKMSLMHTEMRESFKYNNNLRKTFQRAKKLAMMGHLDPNYF